MGQPLGGGELGRQGDHVGRGVEAQRAAIGTLAGVLGGDAAVAAAAVEDVLVALGRALAEQLHRPLCWSGGVRPEVVRVPAIALGCGAPDRPHVIARVSPRSSVDRATDS